jgi:hypothetical protein
MKFVLSPVFELCLGSRSRFGAEMDDLFARVGMTFRFGFEVDA